jgi:hypothetical protein
MGSFKRWRALAVTAVAVGATGTLAAIPQTVAASTTHHCGNKTFSITIAPPEGSTEPASKFKLSVAQIVTTNVSCEAAFKFVKALYASQTGVPKPYKCTSGHFKVPRGKVPEVCTRKGGKIQFAGQGG